jgi:hypothetical protein
MNGPRTTKEALVRFTVGATLLASLAGCVGKISGAGGGSSGPPGSSGSSGSGGTAGTGGPDIGSIDINAAGTDSVSPAFTRRLTKTEVANSIAALTGVTPTSVAMLPDDALDFEFDRVAQSQTVIDRHIQGYLAIGDEVVKALSDAQLATLAPACTTVDRNCAQSLIDTLGKRAFRGPVAPEQTAAMLALFDGAGTARDGVNQVIRFILQSPSFIYLIERGTPVANNPGILALTDYELAARLSFFSCETVPDATLMAAADAGQLHTADQLATQATRLFGLPCAHQTVQAFYTQWFHLDRTATIMPDTTALPLFTPDARQGMIDEDNQFLSYLTWQSSGTLASIFNADFSFVDSRLGAIYGMTGLGSTPAKTQMPPERRGLLTHASILVTLSNPTATSPVRRGAYVYKKILCGDIPLPPPTLDTTPPKDDPTKTTRQRYALRTEVGVCATCHSLMNPIGYTMENFDPIGQVRTTDNGQPIDATGSVPSLNITGLDGGASLGIALADRDELRLCFARKWLRFGLGRMESQTDVTSLRPLVDMARQQSTLKDMMVALSRTYAFSHRAVPPDPGVSP